MNPKQMKQAMKRMGIDQEDINADRVEMHLGDKKLVFDNPDVQKVDMMGQETYQVLGTPQEVSAGQSQVSVEQDDIETVVAKTGCSEDEAKEAIKEQDYDLAAAVMSLNDE